MSSREPVYWNQLNIPRSELCIHKHVSDMLIRLQNNLPNFLFYGPSNNGTIQLIRSFAMHLSDSKQFCVRNVCHTLNDTKETKFTVRQSSQHIEFDFKHVQMSYNENNVAFRIECLLNVLNERIRPSNNAIIVVFQNLHSLSVLEQQKLRVVIEKYSSSFRFFGTCIHKFSITPPIQSRFTHLRIPRPTDEEMLALANEILQKVDTKQIVDRKEVVEQLIRKCNGNVDRFMCGLQSLSLNSSLNDQNSFEENTRNSIRRKYMNLKRHIDLCIANKPNFEGQTNAMIRLSTYAENLETIRTLIVMCLAPNAARKERFSYLTAQEVVSLLQQHFAHRSSAKTCAETLKILEHVRHPVIAVENFVMEIILNH